MSQAKVEEHKEEKLHRREIVKKQKRNRFIAGLIGVVIIAAVVCWIGWSGYSDVEKAQQTAESSRAKDVTPIDLSALTDYGTSLSSEQ